MKNSVLIAYASKKGSTKEIAEEIYSCLMDMNIKVAIKDVSRVENLNDYDTLIIGSAVYYGMWQKSFI
ncbi:MAG: flavodoxin domain-containing protein [Bacillota bacterium]